MKNTRGRISFTALVGGVLMVLGAVGCGSDGPTLHPVRLKLEVPNGRVEDLAGSTLDAALDGDPTVRASGVIGPDGTVVLETLEGGKVRTGAREGRYKARIVLSDDNKEERQRAAKAVPPSYRQFDTSDLTFSVPVGGDVILKLSTSGPPRSTSAGR